MQSTSLYHNLHYNNRLQLVDIRLGDSSTDEWTWTRGALVYYYGTAARDGWNAFANSTDNNGNLIRQVNYAPLSGGGSGIPQLDDYSYDSLNRISSVTEAQQNSGGAWTFNLFTQNFGYDRWGNRTVSCSPCQVGVTGDVFTVNTANNRLTAKNGITMTYDAAGNQTNDATGNRWYDGENRMRQAQQSSTTSYYLYNGDGKRVRRIVGATETWLLYGMDGELIAEYAANGATGSPQKEYGYRDGQMLIVAQATPFEIRWLVTDHLGSPRINVRGTGADGGSLASVTRHDYLPFGEELFVGLRASGYNYEPPADGVRQKFTGYEKDGETGLDFAEARYFASSQGRFTSVDPLLASANVADPGSWNRYAFAYNNPLRFIDPTGMYVYDKSVTEDQRKQFDEAFANAQKSLAKIGEKYGANSSEYKKAARALKVYGDPGVDNGVTIFNKQLGDKVAGQVAPYIGLRKDGNAKINVSIDTEAFSSASLLSTIAHEGSHAADGADFVLGAAKNPSLYRTEFDAYTVSSLFQEASGIKNRYILSDYTAPYKNGRIVHPPSLVYLYESSWAEADKATLRAYNIDTLLRQPKQAGGTYGLTQQRPGSPTFQKRR